MTGDDTPQRHLVTMMGGGLEKRDEGLATGLVYATARQFWLDENKAAEQIAAARVSLTPNTPDAIFGTWRLSDGRRQETEP